MPLVEEIKDSGFHISISALFIIPSWDGRNNQVTLLFRNQFVYLCSHFRPICLDSHTGCCILNWHLYNCHRRTRIQWLNNLSNRVYTLKIILYILTKSYMSSTRQMLLNWSRALGLGTHLYADDTQLYGHCSPSNSVELASRVLRAIDSIHEWMSSNRLSLNTGKTQFIWLGTKHSLAKRDTDRLSSLHPSLTELTFMRNLGFINDQELSMKDHITKLCQSCYYQLRQIRTVRHSLTQTAIQTLVHAFVCTRIDFANSLLYGTSAYLLDRLQSVLNSAARLILKIGKYDPISSAIRRDLHWLPIRFRVHF